MWASSPGAAVKSMSMIRSSSRVGAREAEEEEHFDHCHAQQMNHFKGWNILNYHEPLPHPEKQQQKTFRGS